MSHVFALGGAPTTDQTNAELDIAALGEWLRRAEPGTATALEADARKAAGLSPYAAVTWPIARATRVQLTAPDRIATEFAQADVVFVDGWPLARSEAAAALLYATASNSPQLQPSIHGSEALP
ncbi:MAG: hypothetical protein R3E54_14375 [Halioglobus sp.]